MELRFFFFSRGASDGERAEYAVDEEVLTSGETVRLHRRSR